MQVDYLIVGQGISGTLISYELTLAGRSVMVLDTAEGATMTSKVAGALLNPVAGRNWALNKDQERIYAFALTYYQAMERYLDLSFVRKVPLYYFFGNREEQKMFLSQMQNNVYLQDAGSCAGAASIFRKSEGVGAVLNVGKLDALLLLNSWKNRLTEQGCFRKETFESDLLEVGELGIRYRDINAAKIIFCEGAKARNSAFFNMLPFTVNSGDVLFVSIPDLPADAVYHYGDFRLISRGGNIFWCGSNYRWNDTAPVPDREWAAAAGKALQEWLSVPWQMVDHIVAERPTTAGQFPFVGLHPHLPSVCIFNGFGTRGFSSAPFWARSFADYLCDKTPVISGYDMDRFQRFFC